MRKILISLLLMLTVAASAQNNPFHGYIITNQGDTVRGMIDLKTNTKMSKLCTFRPDGSDKVTDYQPGEIEAYRFDDNGKYYISHRLSVNGVEDLYFAEFVVNGKMNLYCVTSGDIDYYFFEHEDGTMAQVTDRPGQVMLDEDVIKEKRIEYAKAKALLIESSKAMHEFDTKYLSRKKLINVMQDYHKDVCTDGSSCMVYAYDSKAERIFTHFKAFAGYAYINEVSTQQSTEDLEYTCGAPEFGIGFEVDLARLHNGLSAEAIISFSHFTCEKEELLNNIGKPVHKESKVEKNFYTMSLIANQRFLTKGKIQPLVRVGIFGGFTNNAKEYYSYDYYPGQVNEKEWGACIHYGAMLGAGVQIPVGKHYFRVHGDWYRSLETVSKMTKWAATVEFAF